MKIEKNGGEDEKAEDEGEDTKAEADGGLRKDKKDPQACE